MAWSLVAVLLFTLAAVSQIRGQLLDHAGSIMDAGTIPGAAAAPAIGKPAQLSYGLAEELLAGPAVRLAWGVAARDAAEAGDEKDRAIATSRGVTPDHFREMLRLRPAWARGWALFAKSKSLAGQIDEEFLHAWSRAGLLGAREGDVREILIWLGLKHWYRLPEEQRIETVSLMREALKTPRVAGNVRRWVDAFGLAPYLERYL